MKKVLALMLALVLVLSLAACGGGSNSSKKQDNTSQDNTSSVNKTDMPTESAIDAKELKIGDKISLEYVNLTLDKFEISNGYQFKSTDNSSGISITNEASIDCPNGMKLVCLNGKFTNKTKGDIFPSNNPINGIITINDNEYKTNLSCYDVSAAKPISEVAAQRTVDYFLYSEVPNEVANSIKTCEFKIGFVKDLNPIVSVQSNDDFDELFVLNSIPTPSASANGVINKNDANNYGGIWETAHYRLVLLDNGTVEYSTINLDDISNNYNGVWEIKGGILEVSFSLGEMVLTSAFELNDMGNTLTVTQNNLPAGHPDETDFIKQ